MPLIIKLSAAFIFLSVISFAQERPYKQYGIENSQEDLPVGLNVGDIAPNFALKGTDGKTYELYNHLNQPVVLVFYRGKWCGHCNRYLSRLQDSLELIKNAGAILWAITPETVENASETGENADVSYPILSDSDEQAMTDYQVIFTVTDYYKNKVSVGKMTSIAKNNGQEEAKLPVPATFIVGVDNKIIYRYFDYDYAKRAGVIEILEALSSDPDMLPEN